MIYFIVRVYIAYGSVPITLIISIALSAGYFTLGSWMLYSKF